MPTFPIVFFFIFIYFSLRSVIELSQGLYGVQVKIIKNLQTTKVYTLQIPRCLGWETIQPKLKLGKKLWREQ